jgi:hypothetical protein
VATCALCAGTLWVSAPGRAAARDATTLPHGPSPQAYRPSPREETFLDELQRDTFRFFWDASPSVTGLTPDRYPGADVSSVAAVGFALTSYLVGVERGYVTRGEAAARTLATLETLWRAPQGPAAEGTAGYKGLFYHFVDARSAVRSNLSELSTIDTALLMAGVLSAQVYFDREDETERSIRRLADSLYRRVDWAWASSPRHGPLLSMGWTPERGFLEADWRGYNEGMLLYVLALGSPTHPIDPRAWDEWTRTYRWESSRGPPHVTFGPLFGHQYSHVWIDFRGIQDRYMRARRSDYFRNSVRATYANRAYCIANPGRWSGYGELVWGVTASDGPLGATGEPDGGEQPFHAYWARAAGPDSSWDDGTIAPTAAGGSVPFAPEVTIPTLLHFRERFGERLYGRYGFKDAFNLTYPGRPGVAAGWFDETYLGIDQGPILLMVENYRTGFVWRLLKKSAYLTEGLRRAGFTGGWLGSTAASSSPARPALPGPRPDAERAPPQRHVAPSRSEWPPGCARDALRAAGGARLPGRLRGAAFDQAHNHHEGERVPAARAAQMKPSLRSRSTTSFASGSVTSLTESGSMLSDVAENTGSLPFEVSKSRVSTTTCWVVSRYPGAYTTGPAHAA